MIWIKKLKIIVGWTKIDQARVNRWIRERNIDLLKFTLRRGLYSQRLQAIKGLNSLRERSVIPILLEVARTDFEVVAKVAYDIKIESVSLGADDFIEKPFSMDYLLWKIKNALDVRDQWKEKYSRVITAAASEIKTESPDERFMKNLICIIKSPLTTPYLT